MATIKPIKCFNCSKLLNVVIIPQSVVKAEKPPVFVAAEGICVHCGARVGIKLNTNDIVKEEK